MTTIVVSPIGRQEEPTGEAITLDIFLKDESVLSNYDKIEIHRSTLAAEGPYDELTAEALSPARIPADSPDPPTSPVTGPSVVIVGLDLELLINEVDELAITFTGADPITFADAASQIIAQGQSKVTAYVSAAGKLVLQSTGAGTGSSLRVVGGDAAPQLGLPEALSYGRDARPNLLAGQTRYSFTDLFGSSTYFYKTRFRNASTGAVSEFSQAFTGSSSVGIDPAQLACGKLDLVLPSGKPFINAEVRLHSEFNGTIVGDKVMAGGDIVKRTDEQGHVEFVLVRGQKFGVSIPGTNLVREITVPTDPSVVSFNLLDPDISGEDVFKVSVPKLIIAERRSL